jgi:hypothetical protein
MGSRELICHLCKLLTISLVRSLLFISKNDWRAFFFVLLMAYIDMHGNGNLTRIFSSNRLSCAISSESVAQTRLRMGHVPHSLHLRLMINDCSQCPSGAGFVATY